MIASALESFGFGLTVAAAVGPIALLIVSYGLRDGVRPALAAALGAGLADFAYALLAFSAGAAILPLLAGREVLIRRAGAVVLIALGVWLFAGALRARASSAAAKPGRPLVGTFLLTLVNPLTVAVFAAFATRLPLGGAWAAVLLNAASLFLGSLAVQVALALGASAVGRVVTRPGWIRALGAASAAGIAAFGVAGLLRA